MACPTCDHTMQNTGTGGGYRVFWCPRCGTLKSEDQHGGHEDISVPRWTAELSVGQRAGLLRDEPNPE